MSELPPTEESPTLVIQTPRRSKAGLFFALFLLIISAGLCYLAYWGWQQHLEFI